MSPRKLLAIYLLGIVSCLPLFFYERGKLHAFRNDFAGLHYFHDHPQNVSVVFFGDSIIEGWDLAKYFPGKNYLNRGIHSQTTEQMLGRFRQDVLEYHPETVVILAGTNDLAGMTGPETLEQIEGNIATMAELAEAHHVRVVVASLLPSARLDNAKVRELSHWIYEYTAENKLGYLEYYEPFLERNYALQRDGLHPNDAGYAVMARVAGSAIQGSHP